MAAKVVTVAGPKQSTGSERPRKAAASIVILLLAAIPRWRRMSSHPKPAMPAFGFLTVVQQPELGLVGGYLVLNSGGRPLEFHCTAPVKPNRAQEILYGQTLKPYLYGEQIAPALVTRAKVEPLLLLTDEPAVLCVREFISWPVVLVQTNSNESPWSSNLHAFSLEAFTVALENRFSSDQPLVLDHWKAHGQSLDLIEPFSRIREALDEAQKSARAAA